MAISEATITTPSRVGDGPLKALDSPTITTIGDAVVYPKDLGSSRMNHYVMFAIKNITPQGISKIEAAFKTAKTEAVGLSTALQANETGFDPTTDTQSVFGKALKSLGEFMDIQENRKQVAKYIGLYMPDSLKDNYSSDYASISIRDEFGSILNAIRNVATVADNASKSNKDIGTSISNDPSTIKFFVDTFVGALGGGGGIGEALLQAQGYTSNPQLQMIYRGSHFRQFSLEFLFTPSNEDEANAVRYIVFLFKYYASPTVGVGQKSKDAMFLTPPALFGIKFMKGPNENLNLPKYTDCVLEDISVDYAPNGFAAHADGAPIQTHLTLTFQEVEIVDRERLALGYTSYDTKGLR
jgi:hypothetical protein